MGRVMRFRTLALTISVLFNCLLVGFIVGDLSRPIQFARALEDSGAKYPPEIKNAIRKNFNSGREQISREIAEFDRERRVLYALMREKELDEASIRASFQAVRDRTSATQALLQEAILEAVISATADTRAEIEDPDHIFWASEPRR